MNCLYTTVCVRPEPDDEYRASKPLLACQKCEFYTSSVVAENNGLHMSAANGLEVIPGAPLVLDLPGTAMDCQLLFPQDPTNSSSCAVVSFFFGWGWVWGPLAGIRSYITVNLPIQLFVHLTFAQPMPVNLDHLFLFPPPLPFTMERFFYLK